MRITPTPGRAGSHRGRPPRRPHGVVALCLALAACSPTPKGGSREVVARLGEPRPAAISPPQVVAHARLGGVSRPATCLAGESAFELEIASPSFALLFGIGVDNAAGAPLPVRFEIRAKAGDAWRSIFSEMLQGGASGWHQRLVDLEAVAPDARTFRFETAEENPEGGPGARPCWGSVSFLGEGAPPRSTGRAGKGSPGPPPNIVLISLDTLGAAYLGSFGDARGITPRIDRFLERSFSFSRTYAQYGNTLVSHASLFTAMYPLHHGVYPGDVRWRAPSLVETFARHGYLTMGITENGFVGSDFGFARGFDAYDNGFPIEIKKFPGDAEGTFAKAAEWLADFGRLARFFLFLHTYEVHAPYVIRDAAARAFVEGLTAGRPRFYAPDFQLMGITWHNSGGRQFSESELEHLSVLHRGEIHYLDRRLGRFLDRLEELGLAEDTLIVLTSDHGDQFGEHGKVAHGESLHNRVLHVPLGFRWPGRVKPGRTDAPVQLVDVIPTLLELAGIPAGVDLDGRSLAAELLGDRGALPPRPAFSEMMNPQGECTRLKLADRCRLGRYAVQTERFKYISSEVPAYEVLFDLGRDPLEARDVAAERPRDLERHRTLLAEYLASGPAAEPEAAAARRTELDEATRKKLEALGYLR